jgi:hypothetical protein
MITFMDGENEEPVSDTVNLDGLQSGARTNSFKWTPGTLTPRLMAITPFGTDVRTMETSI